MAQLFDRLRGAGDAAGAAADRIGGFTHRLGPTGGADLRECVGHGFRCAAIQVDRVDLGDHVARAIDAHPVPLANVRAVADRGAVGGPPGDVILVVKRRVRHHDPAHGHRGEPRDGRQRAGAAHLDLNPVEAGPGDLGRELVGERPARRRGAEAKPGLQRELVHLVDDAVDVVAKRRAALLDIRPGGDQVVGGVADAGQRVGREPEAAQPFDRAGLGGGERRGQRPPAIGKEMQRPARGHGRVELAQRAARGIAWVREHPPLATLVQGREIRVSHVDLAPDLDQLGDGIARQFPGQVADRQRVRRHVLARRAVAAGRRLHEPAVFVTDRQRQAVDLGFGRKGQRGVDGNVQERPHPGHEVGDVLGGERILERHHADGMRDLAKRLGRGGADLAGGGIGAGEMGELGFEHGQFTLEGVVIGIVDRGRVGAVIVGVGLLDPAGEIVDPRARDVVGSGQGCRAGPRRGRNNAQIGGTVGRLGRHVGGRLAVHSNARALRGGAVHLAAAPWPVTLVRHPPAPISPACAPVRSGPPS